MCVHHIGAPGGQRRALNPLEFGVTDNSELPHGCWEPNLHPLQENRVLLIAELSLQFPKLVLVFRRISPIFFFVFLIYVYYYILRLNEAHLQIRNALRKRSSLILKSPKAPKHWHFVSSERRRKYVVNSVRYAIAMGRSRCY